MSPRRNYPRRRTARPRALDDDRARRGVESVQAFNGGQWQVRVIPAAAALKTYRCPGCDHEICPGVPHVVAWPADGWGDERDRRHWHTGCWRAREQRAPTTQRHRPR